MPRDTARQTTFLATELVARLQQLIREHGDLPVLVKDADTDWLLELGLFYAPADAEGAACFLVGSSYHGEPHGRKGEETDET
jgi:hypothetical protein